MSRLLDNLLLFGRILRRAGIAVDPERLLDVVKALGCVNLGARDEVYHACRTLLVNRQDQIAIFDRAFDAFWRAHHEQEARSETRRGEEQQSMVTIEEAAVVPQDLAAVSDDDRADNDPRSPDTRVKTWSDLGVLTDKDFAAFTAREIADARAALARLAWNPGERRTRRWVRGRGPRLDLRRAIADSIRTSGDIVRFRRRERRWRPRPLVLVCDVSGSMERYTRMLLLFAHAVAARQQRVEAFLFSTRLTRITRQLRMPRPDDALAAVSQSVADWSGGTRIGAALKELRQRWSRRVLHGGPVVLLISDGWDRGDPAELRDQVAWLQRSCHRLVWLNPLIGTADYAPLTRGLQAALPFVDDFLPARTLANLADLAVHLNTLA
jgi:uncharacterized protein with von Willebrand factor type A (vWA) domain